jgi:hypothetical protein
VPRVGINITKSMSFRGAAQEFGNTYYYNTGGILSVGSADALVDNIVAKEKAIFSASVNFVHARAWSETGNKATNEMLVNKPLSGVGAQANPIGGQDRERAFLVRFRAGVDSKGRPAYLRKWWHLNVGSIGGTNLTNTNLENTSQLSAAHRSALEGYGNGFKDVISSAVNWSLVSNKGRGIDGATQAHPYLEHRQLGDMWRG